MRNKKPNKYAVEYKPDKAKFKYREIKLGLIEHNYLCAVCFENAAVHVNPQTVLQPCWDCQKRGYMLVKLNWFTKIFVGEV